MGRARARFRVVYEQGLIGVVTGRERLVGDRDVTDQRVVVPLRTDAALVHPVAGPEPPELGAPGGQIADEPPQLGIFRVPSTKAGRNAVSSTSSGDPAAGCSRCGSAARPGRARGQTAESIRRPVPSITRRNSRRTGRRCTPL